MMQLLMIGDCWQVLDLLVHDHPLWLVNGMMMVMRTKYHLTGHRNYCLWLPWWYFEIEFEFKSPSDQEHFQFKSCSRLNVLGWKVLWVVSRVLEWMNSKKWSSALSETLLLFLSSDRKNHKLFCTVTVTRSKFVKRERDDCSAHSGQHFLITDQTLKLLNFLPFKLFSSFSFSFFLSLSLIQFLLFNFSLEGGRFYMSRES